MKTLMIAAVIAALATPHPVAARQTTRLGSEIDEYIRMLETLGHVAGTPLIYRSFSTARYRDRAATADGFVSAGWNAWFPTAPAVERPSRPTITPFAPEAQWTFNSAYPRGFNDGATWAGRGLTASVSGGVGVRWGPVTGILLPTVIVAQNRSFTLDPVTAQNRSPFAYSHHQNIDFPQRFGTEAFTTLDLGQSALRMDVGAFTAGISKENLFWGPAVRNPIIMSNTAPGFTHVDLGTGRPVSIGVGDLEVRAIWGSLFQSEYFDLDPTTSGKRYLTGLTLGIRPAILPGLTLGATRVLYQQWPASLGMSELFDFFGELINPGTVRPDGSVVNDATDQLLSVTARWVLPESGFETYLEWARGDFAGSIRDLLLEPDHTRAYTVGLIKTLPLDGQGAVRIQFETTTLGRSATFISRGGNSATYYTHPLAKGGYTHRGQLLGAGIGPGSNAQFLGVDRYSAGGRWGVFLQRIRFDDDAFFRTFTVDSSFAYEFHDAEFTAGASLVRFVGDLEIGGAIEASRRLNWFFRRGNNATSLTARLSMAWNQR